MANCLYRLTGEIAAYCIQHDIIVSKENPARSHFWATSFFRKPLEGLLHKLQSTYFHHCMHGTRRRKHILLMHNCPAFGKVSVMCDGSHVHEPWGLQKTWATSRETAYPALLCQRFAEALAQNLHEHGYVGLPTEISSQVPLVNHPKFNQIAAGKQPRGKKIPPMVSEFATVVVLSGPASCVPLRSKFESPWRIPTHVSCSDSSMSEIPAGARVLRSLIYGDGGRKSQEEKGDDNNKDDGNNNMREISVGIQWTPEDFVRCALPEEHPRLLVKALPITMLETLDNLVRQSKSDIAKDRTAAARKWFLRAQELRDEEAKCKGFASKPSL